MLFASISKYSIELSAPKMDRKGRIRPCLFLTLVGLFLIAMQVQAAQERFALVIGNAAYKNETPLVND